jgi:hypothetical protein
MNYKIYSFVNADLNTGVKLYQKRVFDKFNIDINQVVWKKDFEKYGYEILNDGSHYYNDHPHFLDNIIKTESADYLIFFDIDCIPLSPLFLDKLLNEISDKNTLSGAIQINRYGTYVSAWFIGFYKNLYFECGSPPITDPDTDPFLKFTRSCIEHNKRINYWLPSHVERPPFGTTYDNLIYHEMQIRKPSNHESFIKKCKLVLGEL